MVRSCGTANSSTPARLSLLAILVKIATSCRDTNAWCQRVYLNDLPEASLVWLDAGHFVLDENTRQVVAEIKAVFAAD